MVKIPMGIKLDEVHLPPSKWSKERIIAQIGGQFKAMWETWSKEDLLATVMVNDGYQWGGEDKGIRGGYCQLLCINRGVVEAIEANWGDME